MPEYDNMDEALSGLLDGLDNNMEGRWACKESDGILPGKAVFGYVGDNIGLYLFHNDTAKVAYDADFVTDNNIDMTVNGVAITTVPFNTNHATTMADLISEVDGLTGVRAILDSVGAGGGGLAGVHPTIRISRTGKAKSRECFIFLPCSRYWG